MAGARGNGSGNGRRPPASGARERYVAAFLLGWVLFFPPLLVVFDTAARPAGIPLLFCYLYGAWLALILVIAWIALGSVHGEDGEEAPGPAEREP
ncbi:hypothetical protein [Ectothiorhodospira mobilis]|jgi:hypothetical protein|uniref:Uncharacterized protein n=1 Tax=Ectothiorhodospira mobilis TaxID=195064 RepID=A0A1I4R129_ECTMO|nr:hypothetical protein [Ectothiorhodospira mobilis]MCG5536150.1 hypothetical protein [Ectothiorhodospira mobilis]SFM45989.1 hypothetical protein SAMN05421721_10665 [Ectothiorhodospira mobilis]